jgi:hypothetical protein
MSGSEIVCSEACAAVRAKDVESIRHLTQLMDGTLRNVRFPIAISIFMLAGLGFITIALFDTWRTGNISWPAHLLGALFIILGLVMLVGARRRWPTRPAAHA